MGGKLALTAASIAGIIGRVVALRFCHVGCGDWWSGCCVRRRKWSPVKCFRALVAGNWAGGTAVAQQECVADLPVAAELLILLIACPSLVVLGAAEARRRPAAAGARRG